MNTTGTNVMRASDARAFEPGVTRVAPPQRGNPGLVASVLVVAASLLFVLGCSATTAVPVPNESVHSARARHLMGTSCQIRIAVPPDSPLFDVAFDEIDRIETLISTWRPGSELSRVNHAPVAEVMVVSGELAGLLRTAMDWSRKSEGAFNPLVGPLIAVWDTRGNGRKPTDEEIAEAVRLANPKGVRIEGGSVTRHEPAMFEEGGFGKGYAIDRAIEVLKRSNVASGSIDFGGQIGVWGAANGVEVRIAHPENRQKAVLVFRLLHDSSVSTSSASEKTFTIAGQSFSHVIDPRNGLALPPRGSATVISETALDADIGSTAAYVLGAQDGLRWANRNAIAALFLEPSGQGRHRVITTKTFGVFASDLRILDDSFVDETPQ